MVRILVGDESCRHGRTKRGCSICQRATKEPMEGTYRTDIFGRTKKVSDYADGGRDKSKRGRRR